jgi:thiol-disulfide isomerase/thioredoxin
VNFTRSHWIDVFVYGALAVLAVLFVSRKLSGPSEGGQAAPFDLPLVGAAEGARFRLADKRGQAVLIEVFAGWCGACRRSAPTVVEAWKRQQGTKVEFLGVSVDSSLGDALRVKRDWGIPYDVALDDGSISKNYQIEVLPTFILIGGDGVVRKVATGVPSQDDIKGWLSEL